MTLDDLREQSDIVQGHMNVIANLLHLAAITQNPNQLRAIKVVMEYESAHMRQSSDKLNAMMSEFKKEQGGMKRNVLITTVLVVLMFVLVMGIPAVAQDDSLATNTPIAAVIQPVEASINGQAVEATLVAPDEQPPVVVDSQPSDRTIYVVGFLVVLLFSGFIQVLNHKQIGVLADTINRALDNKQVLAEAQQRYMEASMTTQEYAKLFTNIAGFVGAMIPGEDIAERLNKWGAEVIAGPGDVGSSANPLTASKSIYPPGFEPDADGGFG